MSKALTVHPESGYGCGYLQNWSISLTGSFVDVLVSPFRLNAFLRWFLAINIHV